MEKLDLSKLDDAALLFLRDQVASATEARRLKDQPTIQIQDIKIGMKPEDRERARQEINRVLREG
jgi:hypothetical protein